ncbi:hypothetical protein Clacol_001059 [Clathrus columnatus]|uniref:Uncharacterized protein n=1 Tax=Clathrus columnatus TaxID=1419009 RepID=A0AAV5A0X2_9AGAM|nr:hypothetical protein Clacol_001059 [Clathrus columnatus]
MSQGPRQPGMRQLPQPQLGMYISRAKSYIVNLEHRVHRLEALMGIILSSADPAVRSLIMNLSEDTLARDIITEVENGPFGPTGKITIPGYLQRNTYTPNQNSIFVSSRDRREQLIIGNGAKIDPSLPSYQWQDQQIFKVNSRMKSLKIEAPSEGLYKGISYVFTPENYASPHTHTSSLALPPVPNSLPNLGSYSLATRRPEEAEMIWKTLYNTSQPSSAEESDYESDNPADAVGQLALNEKEEVGGHIIIDSADTDNNFQ